MTEYRIDDLAREAGTTTRNVRVYQDNGLLPRPQRRGRVAIYTDRHLRQLRAITRLLSEGFTLKHIMKFLTGLQPGQNLVDVLDLSDLEELVTAPWSHPHPRTMSLEELEGRLGDLDTSMLRRLITHGLIEPTADENIYSVGDVRLIDDFAALVSRGMPLEILLKTSAAVDKKLDAAARELTRGGHTEVVRQRGPGWLPTNDAELAWAADLVDTMRRAARRLAHASLDRAFDEAVRAELHEYQAAGKADADAVPEAADG
ncbi:MerR family transcriptional regulator [Mycolicibacterium peregrinum]|uniref:MerR family transcriptional regulator n=1 Tax=Mycolicibacterium peregrinum TaxID=43304 RepID=UPI0006D7ADEF|nr:MerR family transcriptional regulator [Mycolicibacterium peregrinum]MCV7200471.1 MerR family transcriptional regulator [Mycolicibacterium peregrinum]ORW55939.1 MerR family transcriptional regulator [Mycolicibacterium peregrinum]